ncbi:hypothetical protein BJY01DRAFT_213091 [Aspergillus pseudoustus]|uniref:Uncharacterized protein n=1 Tax=Aspergillus pseudoustus TaxID=1810923 RepID=A0ABR4K4B4_9EURO
MSTTPSSTGPPTAVAVQNLPNDKLVRRVGPTEWDHEPFVTPVTSPWDLDIPESEIPKLLNGFRPQDMDDKWFVYADGPDAAGDASLHLFRSWTGFKVAEVKIKVPVDEEDGINGDARMIEIIWEANNERIRNQTETSTKSMVVDVCKWVLGVHLLGEGSGEGRDT